MLVKVLTGVCDPPPAGLAVPGACLARTALAALIAVLAAALNGIRRARRPARRCRPRRRGVPGHGLTNAAALDEAGVAVWVRDTADLKAVLCDLIDGPLGARQRATGLALFAQTQDDGPAAETARVHRSGLGDRSQNPPLPGPGRPRRLRTRRLAVTGATACAVWACAVGTGVATTYDGPALMRTLGHGLDLDRLTPALDQEGHHS
ncbi:hypothetical protein ACFVW1_12460 [Streptomyces olivochromogenes]|uniref:hypothetical protein n=1 Tax=Streptomyces olivochromogenes TaxID=1963 RepID=UPI0036D8982B